jgi:signal transduction histidine kinase
MTNKPSQGIFEIRTVFDALGQGVLLFDSEGQLAYNNHAAYKILGANLIVLRAQGWDACAALLDGKREDAPTTNELRAQAFQQAEPVHFKTLLAGVHLSCWVTAIYDPMGQVYTMLTIERPDWSALNELMTTFRRESSEAIESTRGHSEIMLKILRNVPPTPESLQLAERLEGFTGMIATHMQRLERFTHALYRLETIRTEQLSNQIQSNRAKIVLDEFVEDYLEVLAERGSMDPTLSEDFRARVRLKIPTGVVVTVSPSHFRTILSDMLRNAVLYSANDSPITLTASRSPQGQMVQLDIIDKGYGIREKEAERVFAPFQRARQPQILAEFGYGISLYLVKFEIEAMGGRIWYTSEEKVGTTFSLKLPL